MKTTLFYLTSTCSSSVYYTSWSICNGNNVGCMLEKI